MRRTSHPPRLSPRTPLALFVLAATFASWGELAAQERLLAGDPLPREVAEGVADYLNDPDVIRFNGRASLPAGASIVGNVGVLDGSILVAGRIDGDLIVIGGNFDLVPGGSVTGDVLLIGGRFSGDEGGIQGMLRHYDESFTFEVRDGAVRLREPSGRRQGVYLGRSRLTVQAGRNYNRVEGLPIIFGPVIDTRGGAGLRVEALATYRTESGFTDDRLGYRIGIEQRFGSELQGYFGGYAYSEVTPIEGWLSDLEASLGAFFLHNDYRDYYERRGWQLVAGLSFPGIPLDLDLAYRDERHQSLPVGSPFTLVRNDQPWRPLPLVAEGDRRSLEASFVMDTRNDAEDPTDGWWLSASGIFGLSGDSEIPGSSAMEGGTIAASVPSETEVRSGTLDLRRYARVDPDSDISFRALLSGSLDGEPLPAQYQHAFGGEGSLPGFKPFSLDCGARASTVFVDREDGPAEVFPSYGCDRMALFQAEYRRVLGFDIDLGPKDDAEWEQWSWYPRIDLSPALSIFVEGGRGWSLEENGVDTEDVADAGVGLHIGDLRLYWAYPLRGGDERVNFFVRFSRRF